MTCHPRRGVFKIHDPVRWAISLDDNVHIPVGDFHHVFANPIDTHEVGIPLALPTPMARTSA